MSSISWADVLDISNVVSNRGPMMDIKLLFLRPRAPEKKGTENKYRVKILQAPTPYIIHWPSKTDEDGNRQDIPFFDAEYSNRPTRNCHKRFVRDESGKLTLDKSAHCPWCEKGYSAQLKYMFNVYDRESKLIRIADVTAKVIDEVGREVKNAYATEGIVFLPESWDEPVPDFIFTALKKGKADYSASATRGSYEVDDEILQAIVAINPKAADECEEVLDYKRYLHPIDRWITPTEVATADGAKSDDSDEEEDDEEVLTKETPKKSIKASVKKKDTPVKKVADEEADEDVDLFDDDEDFDDDSEWDDSE